MLKIILIYVILISNVFANGASNEVLKALDKVYLPMGEITDLSFELHTNEIKNLVEAKVVIGKLDQLYTQAYWYKGSSDVDLVGGESLEKITKDEVNSVMKEKASILWGHNIQLWLEGYDFQKINSGWHIYKDMTGLKNVSELWLKKSKNTIKVIEKKATGSSRTTFTYEKTKWSKGKNVLKEVSRKVYEGIQNQHIISQISYQLHDGVYWLPFEIKVKTTQGLAFEDRNKVKRVINESYIFKNYQVNKGRALGWFSRKSD